MTKSYYKTSFTTIFYTSASRTILLYQRKFTLDFVKFWNIKIQSTYLLDWYGIKKNPFSLEIFFMNFYEVLVWIFVDIYLLQILLFVLLLIYCKKSKITGAH